MVLGQQSQQEVLAGDVLVLELLRLLGRFLEQVGQPPPDLDIGAGAAYLGLRVERALACLANLRGINVAVDPGALYVVVTLPRPEADGHFAVQVTPSWPTPLAICLLYTSPSPRDS